MSRVATFSIMILCYWSPTSWAQSTTKPDAPYVKVNGTAIGEAEVSAALTAIKGDRELLAPGTEAHRHFIDNMVDRTLIAELAREAKLDKDPELQRRLEFLKIDLMIELYVERQIEQKVDEAYLKNYFRQNTDLFAQKEVRVSRLFTQDFGKAQSWATLLKKADQKAFEVLAKNASEDANAQLTQGDLGFVRKGFLEKPVDDFVFSNGKNTISPLITLRDGFAYFLVTDIKPGKPIAYDDVKADVRRLARENFARDLMEQLRGQAKLEWNPEFFKGRKHAP